MERIALKCIVVLQATVLQKPSIKSKTKLHIRCLSRRLTLWEKGDLRELTYEGRTIQKQLKISHNKNNNTPILSRTFTNLMSAGKVKQALQLLNHNETSGILRLEDKIENEYVSNILRRKHPEPQPARQTALLTEDNVQGTTPHHIIFEKLDGQLIQRIALSMKGSGGPSGVDALSWKRFCSGFGKHSEDLCNAIAEMGKRLATSYVDPSGLSAMTACRLVPLNKNPGVRPIGVCEIVRRTIGKAIINIIKSDIQMASGTLQLCSGIQSGSEAAVHALNEMFNKDETEGVLLVDANNAFNSLNRKVALHNIQKICPPISTSLINMYRNKSELITEEMKLLSGEGTTQGDPLAMPMYALSIIPLINKIANPEIKQIWYADDAAAAGKLKSIRQWWNNVVQEGPQYGYYPNNIKSWLIVKPEWEATANKLFCGTNIQITTEGRPYLGAALGQAKYQEEYLKQKSIEWKNEIVKLSEIAETQPQAAYTSLTHGLIGRWTYILRTMEHSAVFLQDLENEIRGKLIPSLTGRPAPTDIERKLLSLSTRNSGLGIIDVSTSNHQYSASRQVTSPLIQAIISQSSNLDNIPSEMMQIKKKVKMKKINDEKLLALDIQESVSQKLKKAMELAAEKGASIWLTALPIKEYGFDLHKGAFRDAICLRYGWTPKNMPLHCECGSSCTVEHCLSCPKGGFPILRHNEVRDILGSTLSEVCHDVLIEPPLQPLSGESFKLKTTSSDDLARLDVKVSGLYGGHFDTSYLDVRVFNPLARSYQASTLSSIYRKQEMEKRRKYDQRVREVEHASFIPFVMSCTGGLAPSANSVIKRIAGMLSEKSEYRNYAVIMAWIRCRLGFAMLRSSLRCIRGSRSLHQKIETSSSLANLEMSEGCI